MALKMNYPDPGEIPEGFRTLYTESENGVWKLTGVEGVKPESEFNKLQELLEKERAEKKSSAGPEALNALKQECEKLRDKLEFADSKLAEYGEKDRKTRIEKALRKAAEGCSIRPEAVADVLARASSFEISGTDNSVLAKVDGEALTPEAWLEKQIKNSPHWLSPSRSAGLRKPGQGLSHGKTPANIGELIRESWNNEKRSM